MARALESQCVVVQAPTIGNAKWLAAADVNVGAAGIYGPPDGPFPDTGVIAAGKMGDPGWVYADVSLDQIREVRQRGSVLNCQHWPEQDRAAVAETVKLSSLGA